MKSIWARFAAEKTFLNTYLIVQVLVASGICLISQKYSISNLWESFNPISPYLIPIACLAGIKIPTLMHNAVHRNFHHFNYLIGELSAQITLISFAIVCINHRIHHTWPDTKKDPHSPINVSFTYYLFTCLYSGVSIVRDQFYHIHGKTKFTKRLFNISIILHYFSIPLRLYAWFCLLGPTLMLYFFLPAYIIFLFTFAHVNYVTHSIDKSGHITILNKNSNLWYKFVNFIADGIYFHKNHHLRPNLYNPKTLQD